MRKNNYVKYLNARIIHCDGGAFVEPPNYIFHDAYFSVVDDNGTLIHFAENIGDLWSGVAEYEAIKWVTLNIKERPLVITSDCTTAIAWAKNGSSKKSKFRIHCVDLRGIELVYRHGNLADQWNAENHSPKKDKSFYIKRYYKSLGSKAMKPPSSAI